VGDGFAEGGERIARCDRRAPQIDDDQVRIGEDPNAAVLKKDEWNVLVALIQSGQLGRL
jgi:hypothetical protein